MDYLIMRRELAAMRLRGSSIVVIGQMPDNNVLALRQNIFPAINFASMSA